MEMFETEILKAEAPVAELAELRDVARFGKLCRECPGYGARWCCPPLTQAELDVAALNDTLLIVAAKIRPAESGLLLAAADGLILQARRMLEPQLLATERELGGRAALFTGRCPHCGDMPCTRPSGAPCRHPDLVRPSLEALGYDVAAIIDRYLGIRMLWGRDGKLPEYLTVVGGIFHGNAQPFRS